MPTGTPNTPETFWATAERVGPCLIWRGQVHPRGYGMAFINGGHQKAHRLAWTLARGPIPPGLFVCHTCDTPTCIEPLHLFLGTHADNVRDMVAKGRARLNKPHGEANGKTKLTEQQVRAMREAFDGGARIIDLARSYGVHKATAGAIVHGTRWVYDGRTAA